MSSSKLSRNYVGRKSQIISVCGEGLTHNRGRQEGLSSHRPGSKLVGLGGAERRESSEGMGLGGTMDGRPSELVHIPKEQERLTSLSAQSYACWIRTTSRPSRWRVYNGAEEGVRSQSTADEIGRRRTHS